jgi:E3 ubiquitin-protein ligase RHA2
MRAALLILLPPMSVLLVVAARNLRTLACLPTSGSTSFRQLSAESKRAVGKVIRTRRSSSCCCKEEEEDAVECVFCLSCIEEGEEIRELKCRHLFHRSCLDRWLARAVAPTCPLCRCRLLTTTYGEEESEDSDMMLLMACVRPGFLSVSLFFCSKLECLLDRISD